ncbi:MAG: radical SAM protein [Candidatus Nealsonbacteria bacterium]|nr:radical SAM protein [Candidatus Nealsonbacteria bacterium]
MVSQLKSIFNKPLTRFIRNAAGNFQNAKFYWKRYLVEMSLGRKERISYVPDEFNIGITFKCNFRCPACTFLLRDEKTFDNAKDMTLEQFNWILDKYQKEIRIVGLTGGEPTMHPQFSEIVQSVKNRGLKLVMPTNGTLIKQRIEALKKFDKINISLDGVDYESFRKIRGATREQYNNIIEGIYLLRDAGIPFRISFLLFEENLPEVKKILEFAEKVKPERLQFESGNPHGSKEWTPLRANAPAVQNFLKEVLKRDDYPFSIRMPIIFDPDSDFFAKQACPQLWHYVVMGQGGDVAFCCHLKDRPEIGNIFQGYDFNSSLMVNFRKNMIGGKYPVDCLYCKNRFFITQACDFEASKKRWEITPAYKKILLKINLLPKGYKI